MHTRHFSFIVPCLVILSYFLPLTSAQKVGVKSKLGYGCFNCALNWTFECPKIVLPYDCRCRSEEFLTTALDCVVSNSNDIAELEEGWKYIRDQCHYWGDRTMSLRDIGDIYDRNKVWMISPEAYDTTKTLKPVRVSKEFLKKQLVGANDTKHHYNVGNNFAWGIIGFWGLVMLFGTITNGIRILNPGIYDVFGRGRVQYVRKYLTLPALFGKNHHSPLRFLRYFQMHTPTRGQSFIVLGAAILNIAALVSFIDTVGETPLAFTSPTDRRLHYLANRTAIVATGQIPLIVLFACRNNPFIKLTGWPYDTFMLYHRWCARFMGIQAIIHAFAIYWSSLSEKVVMYKWHHVHNWRGGNLAVYMVIIMLTLAMRRFRAQFYEIFKATHIMIFLIFITCMVVHISDYGWLGWLYTALAFYALEYSARFVRVIVSGGIQTAHLRLVGADMYRITIPGGRRKWSVYPGSYVYIRILNKDLFWQSHPFSVFQGYSSESDESIDLCCKAQLGSTRILLQKLIANPDKSFDRKVMIEGPYGDENYVSDYDSIFLFAGGAGFTAMYPFATHIIRLSKLGKYLNIIWVVKDCSHLQAFEEEVAHLSRNCGPLTTFRVFVTKPDKFELGTVAWRSHTNQSSGGKTVSGSVESAPISPTAKKSHTVEDNSDRLTAYQVSMFTSNEGHLPRAHLPKSSSPTDSTPGNGSSTDYSSVTGSSMNGSVSGSSTSQDNRECDRFDEDNAGCSLDAYHIVIGGNVLVNIRYGRPNITAEVFDFIRRAEGTKAVCSCGPPLFVDMIRDGIVGSIMESNERVDYFEDAYSW